MSDRLLAATGTFPTAHASRYLQQLCKHFGHKVDVSFDAMQGRVALPVAPVAFAPDDTFLQAIIHANDPAGIDRARSVIDKHLTRFAFYEHFTRMTWQASVSA